MSENPKNDPIEPMEEEVAFIPPHYLLIVAGLGLLLALGVALTQPEFSVVGWGGLGLAALATVAWALIAPEQLRAALTGRTVRYGGTAVVVTFIFIVALVGIYVVVQQQNWRLDVSQTNEFSLSDQGREVIETYAADPTTPDVQLVAFYGVAQGGQRDRATILFDDYTDASNGKISYEFIDPDRNPAIADVYDASSGQIFVVPLTENGEPDADNAEPVAFFSEEQITNTIAVVTLQGDFRALYLNLGGYSLDAGADASISELDGWLDVLRWQTREIGLLDFLGTSEAEEAGETGDEAAEDGETESTITLNDPAADGEVLVILGGDQALSQDFTQSLIDYIDNGGDVVLFSGFNPSGQNALATDEMFSNYLLSNFGIRIRNDIVLDNSNSLQSPFNVIATNLNVTAITQPSLATQLGITSFTGLITPLTHSIEITPILPQNVQVTILAESSDRSYAKDNLRFTAQLTTEDIARTADDRVGPMPVAVMVENTETGARLVLFGSPDVPLDQFAAFTQLGFGNQDIAFNSLIWASGFSEFQQNVPQIFPEQDPTNTPIIASEQQIRDLNFVTVIVLPFGILAVGLFMWWTGRERQHS